MKWTFFVLVWSGVALAANQDKGAQKDGSVDDGQAANNGTDVQAANNSTEVASSYNSTASIDDGNSTDVDNNNNNNSTNNDNNNNDDNNDVNNNNNNNNSDIGSLLGQLNGQNCINIEALQNVDASQVDLASINLGLLNLGSLNLQDQISVAQGILALMNSFCLGNAVNINALLSLGLNNQVQMLLELAQLAQLQSLGFLNVFGVQSLIQSNLLFGNQLNAFNLGVFKREIARVKPTLKRTVARRGLVAKRQCNLASAITVQNLPLCAVGSLNENDGNENGNENDNNNQENQDEAQNNEGQDEQAQDDQAEGEQCEGEQADDQEAEDQEADGQE